MRNDERQALSLLAHVLMQNGLPDRALAVLDGLDALLPGDPSTLRALAVAQLRSKRAADALQTLDRLAALGDALPLLTLLRAQALMAAGRRQEAETAMVLYLEKRQEEAP